MPAKALGLEDLLLFMVLGRQLNLSKNHITKIPLEFFPNSTFSNTKYVDLSENDLTSLEKNIFENLTAVEDLILAGNKLKELPAEIFANNPLEVKNQIFISIDIFKFFRD